MPASESSDAAVERAETVVASVFAGAVVVLDIWTGFEVGVGAVAMRSSREVAVEASGAGPEAGADTTTAGGITGASTAV